VGPLFLAQGLACLTLRSGKSDERLGPWLEDIAMRCDDATWREWARQHAAARQ
jgi:hypothetical protein